MNAEVASFGQLSPPFQFPQPVGAVAGFSVGIEVGIMAGGMLAETCPVPAAAVVVVAGWLDALVVSVDV